MGIKETVSSNAAADPASNDEFDAVTSSSKNDESISKEMKIWLFVIFIFVHVVIIAYLQWFVIPKTAKQASSLSLSDNDDDDDNADNNNEEGKDNKKNN